MCLVYIVESLKRKCLISETPLSRALRVFLRRIAYWTPPLVLSCLGVPLSGGPWQGFHHKITPSWLFFRSTRAKSLVSVAVGIVCQAYEYRPVSTWHTEKHRVVLTKWMNNHLCWIMMAADFAGMQHVVNQVDGKHLWGGAVCEGRWTGSPFSLINRMLSATHSVPASGG